MTSPIPDPPSISYWDASSALREIVTRKLSPSEFIWAEPQLREMGDLAARVVAPLAAIADRESPRLVAHTASGERIDRIDYHPSYREMERIAYGSRMVAMKHDPSIAVAHRSSIHLLSFSLGYLFDRRLSFPDRE